MPHSWRALRPVLLVMILMTLVFSLAAPASHAQDNSTGVTIRGAFQPEVQALMTALRDSYVGANADANVSIDLAGLTTGFTDMCSGAADITVSTEPISDDQIARCGNGAQFVETVLAYEIVALLVPPASGVTCPGQEQLSNLWQGSSQAGDLPENAAWDYLGSTTLTTPIEFYGPQSFTSIYTVFASLLPAEALRSDVQLQDDPAAVLDAVKAENSSVMGFLSLSDLTRLDPDATVPPLSIQDANGACNAPSAESMAAQSYPFARTLYLYVNATSAAREEVQNFMQFVLTDTAAQTAIVTSGYTAPTTDVNQTGVDNVLNARAGRTFTRPVTPVNISTQEVGTVLVGGTSVLYPLTKSIVTGFTGDYPLADVQINTLGNTAGWEAICGDTPTLDVLQTTQPISDEQKATCDLVEVNYGTESIVFAVPASADWVDCLTVDQVSTLLRAGTEETPAAANWNAINPDWPDKPLLVVAPPRSTGDADYVIANLIKDLKFVVRDDMTESDDPLYRAQGIANTDNAITFLRWSDLQTSAAKDSLKVLSIDAGNGCVAPEDEGYPLSYPVLYYFNTANFANNGILRAFLWSFFSDDVLNQLEAAPYAGVDLEALRSTVKDEIFQMLSTYNTAEVTPEATEVAPEATEVAPEATEAAAPAATEAAAPAATQEPAATAEPAATEAAQ